MVNKKKEKKTKKVETEKRSPEKNGYLEERANHLLKGNRKNPLLPRLFDHSKGDRIEFLKEGVQLGAGVLFTTIIVLSNGNISTGCQYVPGVTLDVEENGFGKLI